MTLRSELLLASAAVAALVLSAADARAAECFGRPTPSAKAGATTLVRGPEVGLRRASDSAYRRPAAGSDVLLNDAVRTGRQSFLQLKLCDWSTYMFGPSSESAIEEFYSPDGALQRRLVNFVRGGFRLTSGQTSRAPTDVRFNAYGATMGVRGTSVTTVELDGAPIVLLDGPSSGNNGLARRGWVVFTADDGRTVELRRPGWAVRLGPDGPSRPFKPSAALLQRIYAAFLPSFTDVEEPDGLDGPGSGDPLTESGQDRQQGALPLQIAGLNSLTDQDEDDRLPDEPGRPRPGDVRPPQFAPDLDFAVPDPLGIARLTDLDAFGAGVPGGLGHFFGLVPATLTTPDGQVVSGFATVQLEIDFANRRLAPSPATSFVITDFTVGPDSPTQRRFVDPGSNLFPPTVSFDQGLDGRAAFRSEVAADVSVNRGTERYQYLFRLSDGGVLTLDLSAVLRTTAATERADAFGLGFVPGRGRYVSFTDTFDTLASTAELAAFATAPSPFGEPVTGFASNFDTFLSTSLGTFPGVITAAVQIDLAAGTIGGRGSYVAFNIGPSASTPGGAGGTYLLPLDRTAPLSGGLQGLAFYSLESLRQSLGTAQSPAAGQVAIGRDLDYASIAGLLEQSGLPTADAAAYLDPVFEALPPLTRVSELDAVSGPSGGVFYFEGEGLAEFVDPVLGTLNGIAVGEIDIDFAARAVGGGRSYVGAIFPSSNYSFVADIPLTPFSSGAGGFAVFGDASAADLLTSSLILLFNGETGTPGETADIFFRWRDGQGEGEGELRNVPRLPGRSDGPG